MTEPQEYDIEDLDSLTRDQLGEIDPMHRVLADVLDDWVVRRFGILSGHHGIGLFLELLAAEGYRVVANQKPYIVEGSPSGEWSVLRTDIAAEYVTSASTREAAQEIAEQKNAEALGALLRAPTE